MNKLFKDVLSDMDVSLFHKAGYHQKKYINKSLKAWKKVEEEIPIAKNMIEDEFRVLLGINENDKSKTWNINIQIN